MPSIGLIFTLCMCCTVVRFACSMMSGIEASLSYNFYSSAYTSVPCSDNGIAIGSGGMLMLHK